VADTDPDLADSIVEYVQQRGTVMMEEVVREAQHQFWSMGLSQDKIGWQRFLEGMISMEVTVLEHQFQALNGSCMSLEKWTSGLITQLLEIMHRQWIYRNYIVHDPVSGTLATAWKEELLLEIEHQKELGDAGLLEEDKYLAEVNLEEMATTSGERQHYWLLAIQSNNRQEEETPCENGQVTINFQHLIKIRDVFCVPPLVCHNTNLS
jgi:hypothetical protein